MSDEPADAAPPAESPPEKIDFDRAEMPASAPAAANAPADVPTVPCSVCKRAISTEYWQCVGKTLCSDCRQVITRTVADAQRGATFGRAFLLAGGVAIACGIGYAIFVGVTNFQFALVTIGIGWAIGRSIQRVTRGFGSRKHQVLAVALTYFASSMGYLPAIFKGLSSGAHHPAAATSSGQPSSPSNGTPPSGNADDAEETTPGQPPSSPTPVQADKPGRGLGASVAIVAVVSAGIMLAAPFLEIAGGGISGILGLLIMFFGMQTAWRMSKGVDATLTGPYRVAKTGLVGGGPQTPAQAV